jgi:hypothetical protein
MRKTAAGAPREISATMRIAWVSILKKVGRKSCAQHSKRVGGTPKAIYKDATGGNAFSSLAFGVPSCNPFVFKQLKLEELSADPKTRQNGKNCAEMADKVSILTVHLESTVNRLAPASPRQ